MEMLYFPDDPGLSAAVENWWSRNYPVGKALGYPDCCISAFCNQPPELLRGQPTENDKLRLQAACIDGMFTGFVPCIAHAEMILRGDLSLADLIENRNLAFQPFPNAW